MRQRRMRVISRRQAVSRSGLGAMGPPVCWAGFGGGAHRRWGAGDPGRA